MITEVSSFQLETIRDFHPTVSVLLNITPDHLDRHKTMENYAAAKARIFENQTAADFFIVNRDDPVSWELAARCKAAVFPFSRRLPLERGAFVRDGQIVLRAGEGGDVIFCSADELRIPGAHNLENALAAAAAAFCAGVPPESAARTLRRFAGVPHRLEFVDAVDGVRFVNDSKGTNPDSSVKAIEATAPNIFLIAGGYDKNADFAGFAGAFGGKVKRLLLLGKTAEKIKKAAADAGFYDAEICGDMESCVRTGFRLAEKGDTVLLSPACASWDMYACFEERGAHFKRCVEDIKAARMANDTEEI
jgi:UDP-N-acetylmuramoylalanine--D-glutamate ligase